MALHHISVIHMARQEQEEQKKIRNRKKCWEYFLHVANVVFIANVCITRINGILWSCFYTFFTDHFFARIFHGIHTCTYGYIFRTIGLKVLMAIIVFIIKTWWCIKNIVFRIFKHVCHCIWNPAYSLISPLIRNT